MPSTAAPTPPVPPTYPGAVAPERVRDLQVRGLRLRLREWGDPDAPSVVACHGMFDHGGSFDRLAPLLADRFRIVAIDARGHGDSEWADAYTWIDDLLDIGAVLESMGRPSHLLGHSKGGGQAVDASIRFPQHVRQIVDMDGFGPPPDGFAILSDGKPPPTPTEHLANFLDWRRRAATRSTRRAWPSLDALVENRRQQNPRLSKEWLRYFLFQGARETAEGWVLKLDPFLGRGAGPFTADWIEQTWVGIQRPMLALVGGEQDTWGPLPESVIGPRLAASTAEVQRGTIADAGHFMHIEQPERTAAAILDYLER